MPPWGSRSPNERFAISRSAPPVLDIPSFRSCHSLQLRPGGPGRCRDTAIRSDSETNLPERPPITGEPHEHHRFHSRSRPSRRTPGAIRRVLPHGALAGAVALVAIELYAALLKAAGIHLKAGLPGSHAASAVSAASFAIGVLLATFYGTLTAVILTRFTSRPVRTFTIIATTVTALSLITPIDAYGAAASTKLSLAAGHLIVASIMTTIIRRGISRARS